MSDRKKTVLVCTLSDQLVPNLLSVKRFKPDHLVLLASHDMNSKQEPFLASLKAGGNDFTDKSRHTTILLKDVLSIGSILSDLNALPNNFKDHDWIVNLSGGTKPICIGVYTFFKEKGAKIIYTDGKFAESFVDVGRNGSPLESLRAGEGALLTMDEFLVGYGFMDRESENNRQSKSKRSLNRYDIALNISRHAESDDLLALTDEERKSLRDGKMERDKVRWSGFGERIKQKGILEAFLGEDPSAPFSKYDGEFLTGGWAEDFLFGLLHQHAETLGLVDLRTGAKIAKKSAIATDNELDACCIRGTNLWIFECKSGSQENDDKVDALYKLEAIRSQMGALRAETVFLTTGINIYIKKTANTPKPELKPGIKERIDAFKIHLVDLHKIASLANNSNDPNVVKEILFNNK